MARDEDVHSATAVPAPAEEPDELAERIRAAGTGQSDSSVRSLPVLRRATVVRLDRRDGRVRAQLPVAVRRAALATRETLRNPAVAASVATVATVAAQLGLRLLDQRARGRTPARPAPPVPLAPAAGWVRITETRSVTVQQLRQYP